MRGETRDQGLNSLNFQSANMLLWMQQRFDPSFVIQTKIGSAIVETGTRNIFFMVLDLSM
ncbi:hypothetical protein HanXRQr2_Chr05g0229091 [Helianthus annuus]|uniref:Uncharacterized protein n=1 Tax=Helianthus annuus TaxID=4232 RepID=A0A9K3J1G9_HELAN|nr:hypothetical protein HanXRQr2_Chr05g0229091 [Helianthus annuus]